MTENGQGSGEDSDEGNSDETEQNEQDDPDKSSGGTSQGGINNTTDAVDEIVDGEKGTGIETGSESAEISGAGNGGLVGVQNSITESKTLLSISDELSETDQNLNYEDEIYNALIRGETVVLEDDVKFDKNIIIPEGVKSILDLNGHTLSNSAVIAVLGDLTIEGNSGRVESDIQLGTYNEETKSSGSILTIDGDITLYFEEYGITVFGDDSELNINNGTINAAYFAISGNGMESRTSHSVINITEGHLISREDVAIYHPQRGGSELTISGGTIEGNWAAVQMCSGSLNISGDPVLSASSKSEFPEKDDDAMDGSINDGAAVSIINREGYGGDINVDISGGTFISNSSAVKYYGVKKINVEGQNRVELDNSVEKMTKSFTITGGTFEGKTSAIRDFYLENINGNEINEDNSIKNFAEISGGVFSSDISEYLPDGMSMVEDADGNFVPVETEAETNPYLAAIINEAVVAADGNSVSVSLDSSVKYYINDQIILDDGIELTLDLGGAEVDIAQSLNYGIIIKDGSLDISNGTINYNGGNTAILVGVSERENIDDGEDGKYVSTGASLTVNDIKLYCGNDATAIMLKGNNPELVINGNDTEITAEDYFTIATNGSGTTGASIIVNEGKIVSEKKGAFYLPGNSGEFVINDGTVQGYHYGAQLASGSFEMNGGEIICTYEKAEMDNSENGDGPIVDGAAVSFTSREGYNTDGGECSLTINGGTVKSNNRPAIQVYGYNKNADDEDDKLVPGIQYLTELVVNGGTVMSADGVDVISILNDELPETTEVRGGTFSSDVSRYAADGFECTQDEDGIFTVIKEGSEEPENPDTPETPDDTEDAEQETPSYNGSGSSSGSRNESNRNVVSKGAIYADGTTSGMTNPSSGTWKQNETGWWFERTDGSYPANAWEKLSWNGRENWYHFNAAGYLDAGWFTDTDGSTYYLHNIHDNNFGYMYTGWNMINGNYYYFFNETTDGHKEGAMARGMVTPDGYTVNEDGIWTE